jgi:hypothetical protein
MKIAQIIEALRTAHPWISEERMADLFLAAMVRVGPRATDFEVAAYLLKRLDAMYDPRSLRPQEPAVW